jgi:Histone deacetylase domain
MPVVWSDRCLLHEPDAEIWIGVRTPATEVPARIAAIRDSLDARVVEAEVHPNEALLQVHDPELPAYLASAWDEWEAAGLPEDPGQNRVVPYVFAHAALGARRAPAAVWARPGHFAYDTMTLVGPGTWEAARAAVDCALTAVDLVLGGEPVAYACTRPPGHHAGRACYGGSCYLNTLPSPPPRSSPGWTAPSPCWTSTRTTATGRRRSSTSGPTCSSARCTSTLAPAGSRTSSASPTRPATARTATCRCHRAQATSLGWRPSPSWPSGRTASPGSSSRSAWTPRPATPESPLEVTAPAFRSAGALLGGLGLPTVVVQEGGYDLERIGPLVREALLGLAEGRAA